jgi:hypothetical protein
MPATDDDPVDKRVAEIFAEQEAAARRKAAADSELRAERGLFAQRFLDALSEKTPHVVECVEAVGASHGAIARFSFVREGKSWTLNLFEFGIDRVGDAGAHHYLYYIEPTSAAFGIVNPDTGVARPLRNSPEAAVHGYAVVIAIESMAQVIASGGVLGYPGEVEAIVEAQEQRSIARQRQQRRERGREVRGGCFRAILWFFGIVVTIGLLGDLVRTCSGGG